MGRTRTWLVAVAAWLVLAWALLACKPQDNVVAELLIRADATPGVENTDAGMRAADAATHATDAGIGCPEIISLQFVLKDVVEKGCRVPIEPPKQGPLAQFLWLQGQPSKNPELAAQSPCDSNPPQNPYVYMDGNGLWVLCPFYCNSAMTWLITHEQQNADCILAGKSR